MAVREGNHNGRWFRGQLHAHTCWSDGRGLPELAAHAYKSSGYDFLCMSEHNRFAGSRREWREVAADDADWPEKLPRALLDACQEQLGPACMDIRRRGQNTCVRLKSHHELRRQFEEPGRFLLMPGVEITLRLPAGDLHLNYVNLPLLAPSLRGLDMVHHCAGPESFAEWTAFYAGEINRLAAERRRPCLLMLNHPFWRYYDIAPGVIDGCAQIRFFEIYGAGSHFPPHPAAPGYDPDKFWDAANAWRCMRQQPLLYGVASDDTHRYGAEHVGAFNGVGNGWIMVRAPVLSADALLAAMYRGDFYATTGVLLRDLEFTPSARSLRVAVQALPGVSYRITFITTRRGFDRTVSETILPAEDRRPQRRVPLYARDIGSTVMTVSGAEAVYRMADDDLYVRARVESDRPNSYCGHFHPVFQTAWTQPYC